MGDGRLTSRRIFSWSFHACSPSRCDSPLQRSRALSLRPWRTLRLGVKPSFLQGLIPSSRSCFRAPRAVRGEAKSTRLSEENGTVGKGGTSVNNYFLGNGIKGLQGHEADKMSSPRSNLCHFATAIIKPACKTRVSACSVLPLL